LIFKFKFNYIPSTPPLVFFFRWSKFYHFLYYEYWLVQSLPPNWRKLHNFNRHKFIVIIIFKVYLSFHLKNLDWSLFHEFIYLKQFISTLCQRGKLITGLSLKFWMTAFIIFAKEYFTNYPIPTESDWVYFRIGKLAESLFRW